MTEIPKTPFKIPARFLPLAGWSAAALISLGAGWGLAHLIEGATLRAVHLRLVAAGHEWANVTTDGLTVTLTGTAQSEAQRFAVVSLTGQIVDPSRIDSQIEVTPPSQVEAPRFSVEILRSDGGVQINGLVPDGPDRDALIAVASDLPGTPLSTLETAAYAAPETWAPALTFGTEALKLLPRSKISVAADRVRVVAMVESEVQRREVEAKLRASAPKGVDLALEITAPRPVITPFTLRFVLDDKGARFDACSADTEAARARILTAAGVEADCTIGMGVPSPSWAAASEAAISAIKAMGAGSVTFSDADITLEAADSVSRSAYDAALGDLRAALPDVFSLEARLNEAATAGPEVPTVFTAKLAPETRAADLRGPLLDERMTAAVSALAKSQFGATKVKMATVTDPNVPEDWTSRVFAALDALAVLESGSVTVSPDLVVVTGISGLKTGSSRVSQLLSAKLGQGQRFRVEVTYDKALDPMAGLPTPQECLERVQTVMSRGKIAFDPGSAEIASESASLMDALAKAFNNCGPVKIEIGGHTDAQGSAEGNQALSKARAQAVLVALQGRMVDVTGMSAVGYGEGVPVADNGSEEGRLANRRIEFKLAGQAAPTLADLAAKSPVMMDDKGEPLAPQKPTPRPKARPKE
jgi:OOP family OmpA-OmpF porin